MVRARVTGRRRAVLAAAITLGLVVAGIGAVEIRAARASAAERATLALARVAAAAAAATADAAARAEQTILGTERRTHSEETAARARTEASAQLTAQLAAADPILAASEGKVADESTRTTLAAAIDAGRAALATALPALPLADVAARTTAVDAARAAVEQAQAQWQAAADAARGATKPATKPSTPTPAPTSPAVPVFVTSIPTADGDGSNGHLPASVMCLVPWGTDQIGSPQYLRCDAEAALTRLNDAFEAEFGAQLAMDLTYRSYADQVAIRAYFGASAARPGTSSHGLGIALDVQDWPDVYGFGTPRYAWLLANGPAFGWVAPDAVRQNAAYPEFWHFEYRP